MKKHTRDWLKVLVLLLDDAAVLVLALLAVWFFKIKIPLAVIITLALLFGALVFLVHKLIIPSFHLKQVTGAEGMIGREGEVIKPLTPVGVVRVEGEYWQAKSVSGDVPAGESVEILRLNRLVLEVMRKER